MIRNFFLSKNIMILSHIKKICIIIQHQKFICFNVLISVQNNSGICFLTHLVYYTNYPSNSHKRGISFTGSYCVKKDSHVSKHQLLFHLFLVFLFFRQTQGTKGCQKALFHFCSSRWYGSLQFWIINSVSRQKIIRQQLRHIQNIQS